MSTDISESPARVRADMPDLLTTVEAAAVLRTTAGVLEVWRCTRRYSLPFVKIGRSVRYRRADLLRFIESRTVSPEPVTA